MFASEEDLRRKTTKDPGLTVGKGEDGTILGDHRIDETELSADTSEVREDSTGYDDDNDPPAACLGDGRLDAGGKHTVSCNRSIIIECQYTELHRGPAGYDVMMLPNPLPVISALFGRSNVQLLPLWRQRASHNGGGNPPLDHSSARRLRISWGNRRFLVVPGAVPNAPIRAPP